MGDASTTVTDFPTHLCVCRCPHGQTLAVGLAPQTELASHIERKHYEKDIRFQSVDPDATGQPLNVATYQVRGFTCTSQSHAWRRTLCTFAASPVRGSGGVTIHLR